MATSWKYGLTWSMFSALEIIPVRSTPKNVPMILPLPPVIGVPPMTTAPIACSSIPFPVDGLRGADAGQQQHGRGADQKTVDDEEDELVEVDRNPREVAGLGVAADGECPAAQLHVLQDEVHDEIAAMLMMKSRGMMLKNLFVPRNSNFP